MWFMELCPSHFLITFWYLGALNDSFWNVSVVMCCGFNSKKKSLILELCPTLFCEVIFWVQTNGDSLCCEKKEPWVGRGWWPVLPGAGRVPLDRSPRLCGPRLANEASDKRSSSFSSSNSHPSNIWNPFGVDWDVLCLISTRNERASLGVLPGRPPCRLYGLLLFLCLVAHAF